MDDPHPTPPINALPSQYLSAHASVDSDGPPLRWPELVYLIATVVLADLAIYRGEGYAGCAAILAATPVLLFFAAPRRQPDRSLDILALMLAIVAVKLLWCGSPVALAAGLALLPLFAMSLAGRRPYILDGVSYAAALVYLGGRGLAAYGRHTLRFGRRFGISNWIVYLVPAIVGIAFSVLFVLANPDLVESLSQTLGQALERIRSWLDEVSPLECLFLLAVAWIAIGLVRPGLGPANRSAINGRAATFVGSPTAETAPRPLFLAWRNTLLVVILIYGVYLGFEFRTLWFRVFPSGFYYSGYAHEGAAWLTIGLALATSILSLIFRGRILTDSRVKRLERLAWIWSLENLLLAAAVYHRLFIYVGFNGMTRLRIVGLYGASAVVVGFLLVLVKIIRRHDFAWLLQRHLWTLGLAIYLYAITPADFLAMRYNVSRILSGNPAPSVQIAVQPMSAEGLLALSPLLGHPDQTIRDGVAALLEKRRDELQSNAGAGRHWTAYQFADSRFLEQLNLLPPSSNRFKNAVSRAEAWGKFKAYAYQWY